VYTPTVDSLVDFGVLKKKETQMTHLLARENIDKEKLREFARTIACFAKLPETCAFADEDQGTPDVAIFDFSGKRQATQQAKFVVDSNSGPLALLCGDALVEPFWPTGTGANRAVLSALDAAWMLKGFLKHGRMDKSFIGGVTPSRTNLLEKWAAFYQVMRSAEPVDLVANFSLHSIEPRTRYRNLKKL